MILYFQEESTSNGKPQEVEKKSKDSDDVSDVSSYWTLDQILPPL